MYSILCALDTQNHDVNGIHHYYRLFHHHLHTSGLTSTGKYIITFPVVIPEIKMLFNYKLNVYF